MLSRMKSAVLQTLRGSPQPSPTYGDILRNVPFHVHNRVVAFFSTHSSFCDDLFGVGHGACVRFTRGPWMDQTAIVVGVRGGVLWVVSEDGPVTARPITDAGKHQWKTTTADAALVTRFSEGLEAAKRDAELDYDSEQREFLQKAPDLYAELVDDEDGVGGEDFLFGGRWSRRHSGGSVAGRYSSHGGASFNADYSHNCDCPHLHRHPDGGEGLAARRRVILVPQVVQVTGGLGWAGEGVVVLDNCGVKSSVASLSASVLL